MNSQEIKTKFELIQNEMRTLTDAFPWEDTACYVSWLAQTYEYANNTTRILSLTAGHFDMDKTALATRFIQHAAEEKGHEKLLTHDAKALGYDLKNVPALAEAEAFHKTVYYWIHHGRLAVIMGWILFLEGLAAKHGVKTFERVQKAHGTKASSFLRVHTQEDPDHVDKAFDILAVYNEKELFDVHHGLVLYSQLYKSLCQAIITQETLNKQIGRSLAA